MTPDRFGEPVETQGDAIHGIAEQHAQQGDGVLGGIPGLRGDHHPEGEQGQTERGDQHGADAQAIAPATLEAILLAGLHLAPGHQQHHQGQPPDPEQVDTAEQRLEHQADEKQL